MKICDFCYKEVNIVYPYAIPQTLDTVELCKECIEEEVSMTVEELFGDEMASTDGGR